LYETKQFDAYTESKQFEINNLSITNNHLKNELESTSKEFDSFKSIDHTDLLKKLDITTSLNTQLIIGNQEMNKIIDQIHIKQKYRLATDDTDEISTGEMVKKLIDTDVILKTLNDKFMNLAN